MPITLPSPLAGNPNAAATGHEGEVWHGMIAPGDMLGTEWLHPLAREWLKVFHVPSTLHHRELFLTIFYGLYTLNWY
jgi:hypothetical protein